MTLHALSKGAKLQHGHMPLYVRGDDEAGRAFPSLHAVQRHMADTGRFKLAWEGNEEEYEDFYDFDAAPMEDGEEGGAGALATLRPCPLARHVNFSPATRTIVPLRLCMDAARTK
jgi:hypothetical protein